MCVAEGRPAGDEGRESEVIFMRRLGVDGREGPASSTTNFKYHSLLHIRNWVINGMYLER